MIELNRLYKGKDVTLGALLIDGVPICWTLEEPWNSNLKGKSCIPIGHYRVNIFQSVKFGECYRITDLANREPANRTGILIHAGNTTADTSGCILLGLEIGKKEQNYAVFRSRDAMALFMNKMSGISACDFVIT